MAQTIPWIQMMNQQAQAIPPRSDMNAPPPQDPDEQELQDLQESGMLSPGGAMMSRGAPAQVTPMPKGKVQSITTSQRVRNPDTAPPQGTLPYDQMMRQVADQIGQQSQQALQGQQDGLKNFQDSIDAARNAPKQLDYTPLVGMAKFLSPDLDTKDMMQAAQNAKPLSDAEAQQKDLALQNMLQERKENMSKQQLDALKDQLQAYKASKIDPLDTMLKTAKIGFYGTGRQALQTDRIDEQDHRGILSNLEHNKTLTTQLGQIRGIDNAGKIIEDAQTVTPQVFDDYQQALVSAVNRGNAGIAERAKRYMSSAGISGAEIGQYLSGQPMSIPDGKQNAFYKAMQGFAQTERANINQQKNAIVDAAAAGQGHVYDRRPDLKKDLMDKVNKLKDMGAPETPADGSIPVDADLGSMTNDQLRAYTKAHGGK